MSVHLGNSRAAWWAGGPWEFACEGKKLFLSISHWTIALFVFTNSTLKQGTYWPQQSFFLTHSWRRDTRPHCRPHCHRRASLNQATPLPKHCYRVGSSPHQKGQSSSSLSGPPAHLSTFYSNHSPPHPLGPRHLLTSSNPILWGLFFGGFVDFVFLQFRLIAPSSGGPSCTLHFKMIGIA